MADRAERDHTDPNIPSPDDFYDALIEMHRGLTPEQSAAC